MIQMLPFVDIAITMPRNAIHLNLGNRRSAVVGEETMMRCVWMITLFTLTLLFI